MSHVGNFTRLTRVTSIGQKKKEQAFPSSRSSSRRLLCVLLEGHKLGAANETERKKRNAESEQEEEEAHLNPIGTDYRQWRRSRVSMLFVFVFHT